MAKPLWVANHSDPDLYTLRVKRGGPRVMVHRYIYDPGRWYLSVHEAQRDLWNVRLKSTDLAAAQREALKRVRSFFRRLLGALPTGDT